MQHTDFLGKWSAYDVTGLYKDKNQSDISSELYSLENGVINLDKLLNDATHDNSPSIEVDISPGGKMIMNIVQSMAPALSAKMDINASMNWDLKDDRMVTEPDANTLKVRIITDNGQSVSADKVTGMENEILLNLKSSPQWSNANIVRVIYSGKKLFLTRSESGTMMLHFRKEV